MLTVDSTTQVLYYRPAYHNNNIAHSASMGRRIKGTYTWYSNRKTHQKWLGNGKVDKKCKAKFHSI